MGYLSQKKHKVREKVFFIAATVVMTLVTLALLINHEFSFLGLNLFHFYCISWLLLIGAVAARKLVIGILLGIILLVNYVLLAMSTNIFFSDSIKGDYHINVTYKGISEYDKVLSKGILMVGQTSFAEYAVINEEAPIMLIKVDLNSVDKDKYALVLQSLRNFVMKQNVELVVWGDFGVPAWSKVFRDFIDASGLSVKNRLIFYGFSKAPSFYILGYSNIGVNNITHIGSEVKATIDYNIL